MLRFLLDVRHRCGVDVSTMDTDALLGLVHRPIVASRATVPPRNPVRASASNVSRQDRLLRPRGRYLMSRVRGLRVRTGDLPNDLAGGVFFGQELMPVRRETGAGVRSWCRWTGSNYS